MALTFILVPLVMASLLPLIGKISKRLLPDVLSNIVLLFLLLYTVFVGRQVVILNAGFQQLFWFGEKLNINLALDGFSVFMLLVISLVSFAVGLFSINYMERYGSKSIYYALLLIMIDFEP